MAAMEGNTFSRWFSRLCDVFTLCCTCDDPGPSEDEYRRNRQNTSTERTDQYSHRYQDRRERQARRTAIATSVHDASRHQRTAHGFSSSNKRKASEPPKSDYSARAAKRRTEESEGSKLASKVKHVVMTKCPLFPNNLQTSLSAEEFDRACVHRDRATECWERINELKKSRLFGRVKEQRQEMDNANHLAALTFLSENLENKNYNNTIDVHYLLEEEASQALDIFLDKEIRMLQDQKNTNKKPLCVITGQGKHSQNNESVLKPRVMNRLLERGLRQGLDWYEKGGNAGRIIVYVSRKSKLTTDLKNELLNEP